MNDQVFKLLHWAPQTRSGRMVNGFLLGAFAIFFFGLAGVLVMDGRSADWSRMLMNAVIVGGIFAFLWGFIFPRIWNLKLPDRSQ